jgi:hypothetical protein
MKRIALPALTLALVAALSAPAAAQSTWLDREHRPSVLVEGLFPNFDDTDENFPTAAWYAAARLPLGKPTMFVFELPYSHGDIEGESESSIGNPYLGIEYAPKPSGLLLEFGGRIPLASDDKLLPFVVGYLTDVERQEAFVPDQVTVRLGLHYHHAAQPASRIAYDFRFVPSVWAKTSDQFLAESELFFGYGAWMRYESDDVRVGGGLTGRWNVTNDGADFGEASFHQFDLGADFLRGPVRPGVLLKLPLDQDLRSTLNSVVGVSVTVLPGQ